MAFAVLVESLNLIAAGRRKAREKARADREAASEPVRLRSRFSLAEESVAVAAATSKASGSGAVGLSRRPIDGAHDDAEPPRGLG